MCAAISPRTTAGGRSWRRGCGPCPTSATNASAYDILDLGEKVKECADECRNRDNLERLDKWRVSLEEDEAKARRWVKRPHIVPNDPKERPGEQAVIDPVDRLQREAIRCTALWNSKVGREGIDGDDERLRHERTWKRETDKLREWLQLFEERPSRPVLADELQKAARRGAGKAPGPDGWTTKHL